MQIVLTISVWVRLSQDPMEGPEDFTAARPCAGERQGGHVRTQPQSEGCHLEDGKVPQVLTVLLTSFCSYSPSLLLELSP